MLGRKIVLAALVVSFLISGLTYCQQIEDNWNDYLHYLKIGRFDLAKGYAQAILEGNPDPVQFHDMAVENELGYTILLRAADNDTDAELKSLSQQILAIIEKGRFEKRTSAQIIVEEIQRLSTTARGRLMAVKRLRNSGEYAIPYMIDAMLDVQRKEEFPNIVWALPEIGKDAIRPLVAALQMDNVGVKAEIIKALGEIGYPDSLGYLKYVYEKDESSELRALAQESIQKIDSKALTIPAAEHFYGLAENYYYAVESLKPAEDADFGNIWFWDKESASLTKEKVDKVYFYQLMSMRTCEWALKADENYGKAIGLWLAAFYNAESSGVAMPDYFGENHADAMTYAATSGPEYIHQALARAIKDENAYVALGAVEALAKIAGERSIMYQVGPELPLMKALSFSDRAVRYSAAIAVASANPKTSFAESSLVTKNLAEAISLKAENIQNEGWSEELINQYALRAANALLDLAVKRNQVINLEPARETLQNATRDSRVEIKVIASEILAHFQSPDAQRVIVEAALSTDNPMDIRIKAFASLADSAKINGNLLTNESVDQIYSIISSQEEDADLRTAAASAYGSLNLPSIKVKELILDQSRS